MYSSGVTLAVTNCIFWRNSDTGNDFGVDRQIYVAGGTASVTHCSIGDGDPNDASIPFGGAANFNIDDDPLFVNAYHAAAVDADLRLQTGSPCIGRGNCAAVPADVADLNGNGITSETTPHDLGLVVPESPRFNQRIDLGAFEQATVTMPCINDCNFDGVVNINDLVIVITGWGPCPASPAGCPGDIAPFNTTYPCGSGTVDIDDLVAILTTWGCGQQNPQSPPQSVIDCLTQYSNEIGKLQACIEAMLRGGTP